MARRGGVVIGTTLDKYEVLQKLGEGGMATVYRGRHATLDRDVAIKVLHPHLSSSPRNRQRFAREARAIEQLHHEHILAIHDYSGVDASECWIVTELVEGETLTELVDRVGRVPSEVSAALGIALADALAYAHGRGILHRDLKPDNVMIRRDGVVKLMDFGIARFLDESHVTMTGALVGSPAFMSPEQAREEPLDARSDLFSLGTLLYHLVSGYLPFTGTNPSLVLKHIIEGDRAPITDVAPTMSAALADVIERLMAPDREDRFAGAGEVCEALRGALDEVAIDPSEPRWSIARFLHEPELYDADLRSVLTDRLLAEGRRRLAGGDHLGALRLINRLLSMDEANADALALLEGFHGVVDAPPSRRRRLAWGATAVLVVSFGGLAARWALAPPRAEHAPETTTPIATLAAAAPTPAPQETLPDEAPDAPEPPVVEAAPPAPPPTIPAAAPRAVTEDGVDAVVAVAEPPAPLQPACIAFRSLEAPAEVFVDGQRFGSTRDPDCTEIPPGDYTFVLQGSVVETKLVPIHLDPGERREREIVHLTRKPIHIAFADAWDEGCAVLVDGLARGTLASLARQVEIAAPEQPHEVELDCGPRGERVQRHFERFDAPVLPFEPRDAP